MNKDIFEDLFVLEMAQNHYGDLKRGLRIINEFSKVIKSNNVRAAIKLQFREVDTFVHRDFKDRKDIALIKKSLERKLSKDEYRVLVDAIKKEGIIAMCTPFDEKSVDLCEELGIDIIKIQSSDINDWLLIKKIAQTRKPVIVSTGGASLSDIDDIVSFFKEQGIPFAINHCVSMYPTKDKDMQLNQIEYLKNRYPNHTIGLSSHEHGDWTNSVVIAYAKGARTFERHIDIDDGRPIPPYNSLPLQIDKWFKAFKKAKEMCGASGEIKRIPLPEEIKQLNEFVRGIYAKRDLPKNHTLSIEDIYLAVPLQKGQISGKEFNGKEVLLSSCKKDQPIMIDAIDSPYINNLALKKIIYERGI